MKKIFSKLFKDKGDNNMSKLRGFEPVKDAFIKNFNVDGTRKDVLLPVRGTKTSAGYDFYTPVDIVIPPQETVCVWTDVKAYMQPNEMLLLDIRSSLGVKHDLMVANTIGVIDSDYYSNKSNDGNIAIALRNLKPSISVVGYNVANIDVFDVDPQEDKVLETSSIRQILIPAVTDLTHDNTVVIPAGSRIAQGVFVKFAESDNCNTESERTGGLGSTTKTDLNNGGNNNESINK